MCGIVGYVGCEQAEPILLEGLRRLEYRGYDSAGMATLDDGELHVRKRAGRIAEPGQLLREQPLRLHGISHTAGRPTGRQRITNAHPHVGGDGAVAVVHNGVIENYAVLKRQLQEEGVVFQSETDTEVIAQLIARHLERRPGRGRPQDIAHCSRAHTAWRWSARAIPSSSSVPAGQPAGARHRRGENFLASDPAALVGYTDKVVYLQDHQLCVLRRTSWQIQDADHDPVEAAVHQIDWESGEADKGPFEHYMLKEIYEQPEALENAMRGRLDDADASAHFGGLNLDTQQLRRADRFILTACGTSYHAALVGEYLFEELARIPVEVEYASEFRYRNPPWTATPSSWPSRSPAKQPTRWRPCANQTQRASDLGAVQRRGQHASPGRPTAASTCTPARKSAWPAPRHSPPR